MTTHRMTKEKKELLLEISDKLNITFNERMIDIALDMLEGGMSVENMIIILEEMRTDVGG
ncbi:hypothetical protein THOM_2355 [Trachipleistophora hominis]|uniref:Uncharacterized protein n=1 Tax=Trachipleistophora hominis TaxID=72359 RepID=L7JTI8_TRAHO|nr:hypothetical protein THOM_2355 [Trachipleistophora hominis]